MSWEIRQGDALTKLREMPAESVQTIVTSPPYWGLRDYGTAEWDGGDSECDHDAQSAVSRASSGLDGATTTQGGVIGKQDCRRCGAKRIDSQLGLEPTPEQYVANLVAVFREVRRVLRKDGTAWLNLGDSYSHASVTPNTVPRDERPRSKRFNAMGQSASEDRASRTWGSGIPQGLKPKDLVGIPWRTAFALQADGWWLRSDIIWSKPNPMPESVTDRPTRAHEYIFLLTKSARYFFDQDAIREEHQSELGGRTPREFDGNGHSSPQLSGRGGVYHAHGRNRRSVWEIATAPFAAAHFAVFPPKLVEPCILAGTAEGDTVLDCFCGSGTTGVVALRHDRSFIGIELNPAYCEMARNRVRDDAPLLNTQLEVVKNAEVAE